MPVPRRSEPAAKLGPDRQLSAGPNSLNMAPMRLVPSMSLTLFDCACRYPGLEVHDVVCHASSPVRCW
jgi:hypothetical protein